jgi:hypothetical protein
VPLPRRQFPPLANVNAMSDGSAKSERLVHEANARAAASIASSLRGNAIVVIGCSGGAREALQATCGEARTLRDGAPADAIALVVQPSTHARALLADCRSDGARGG